MLLAGRSMADQRQVEACNALWAEIEAWPLFGSRSDVNSAIQDHATLLVRNRTCEESIAKLEGVCAKLRQEKSESIAEISKARQESHQAIIAMERQFQDRISTLMAENEVLQKGHEKHEAEYAIMVTELATVRTSLHQATQRISELEATGEKLQRDLHDTEEALAGEQEAREAAVFELDARQEAKETAQKDKEMAEGELRKLQKKIQTVEESLGRDRQRAKSEQEKYLEKQRLLDLEKKAWEEQCNSQRSAQPAPGFTFGSMVGSVRNVLRVTGALQQQSGATSSHPPEDLTDTQMIEAEDVANALATPADVELIYQSPAAVIPAVVLRRHSKKHSGGCNCVCFSPSGLYAATGGKDGAVCIWHTHDCSIAMELKPSNAANAASINSVHFSEEKGAIMAASNDKSIKVWDIHSGRLRFTMTGHSKPVLAIKQHPNLSNVALSCGDDRLIKVWSLSDGICQRSILCRSKPLDVAFSSDGQFILSGHFDGSLHVFDASTGSEMKHVDHVHRKDLGPCLAVVPTMMPFRMASVGRDSVVCITDVYQGEVLLRFEHPERMCIGHQRCTPAVAPDDSVIAVGTSSGALLLLDLKTGAIEKVLTGHNAPVTCVAWNTHSDDSQGAAVAASVDKNGDVLFWKGEDDPK